MQISFFRCCGRMYAKVYKFTVTTQVGERWFLGNLKIGLGYPHFLFHSNVRA